MPNWTYCTLEAPAEVIEKYLSKDDDNYIYFDFNRVIPRPEIYSDPEMTEGGDTQWCIYWYLSKQGSIDLSEICKQYPDLIDNWFINYESKMQKLTNPDDAYRRGKKYVSAYKRYGYTTWYQWCNANWGTKWNACETYYDPEDKTRVEFSTAWCAPMPIIKKIFKDNPDREIKFSWYDEDYSGHYELLHTEQNEIFEDNYWIDECEGENE